ncbi:UDP-Glycosyltransferase superfamily protein [Striga asiatica]|uniref:UDP-Glycosyltransferase superfamily protein n=1 Tax=Striga asiatica TaxID=4170 RepID=A0A5A7P552_STRAF|nr:UDP-Glycosyltransferase superfamily protein [Striga asiatica]
MLKDSGSLEVAQTLSDFLLYAMQHATALGPIDEIYAFIENLVNKAHCRRVAEVSMTILSLVADGHQSRVAKVKKSLKLPITSFGHLHLNEHSWRSYSSGPSTSCFERLCMGASWWSTTRSC